MTLVRTRSDPCPCPPDGVKIGNGTVAHVDFLDGYPSETGEFAFDPSLGVDRGTSEDDAWREMLGLPDAPGASDITLRYKLGSGILVKPSDPEYPYWKGHRLDCGCEKYECEGSDGTDYSGEYLPCSAAQFAVEEGYDMNPDRIELVPVMVSEETVGCGGFITNGDIASMFEAAENADSGEFKNYVDDYGIVYSAWWSKNSNGELDITSVVKDPRIPGQQTTGRVVKTANGLRVFRRGVITTTREIVKLCNGIAVVIKRGSKQEIGEFQTSFGCGEQTENPFSRFLDNAVTDQVELVTGSDTVIDPEEVEFVWQPSVIVGTDDVAFSSGSQTGGNNPASEFDADAVEEKVDD